LKPPSDEVKRQREAEPDMDDGDRDRLAGDGKPAEADEGLEPKAAAREIVFRQRLAIAEAVDRGFGHGRGRTSMADKPRTAPILDAKAAPA
jgi:hypothetical protein